MEKNKVIDSGIKVLKLEAAAMQLLSKSLTSGFYNAVDLLSKCKGKIDPVFCGIIVYRDLHCAA